MSRLSQEQHSHSRVKSRFQVSRADLPLHCPLPNDSKWDSHPRVFLDIEQSGEAKCPYCGAEYQLIN
jgi:uncharacterized Zn-finger protein